jgi:hypothetical protein
MEYSTAANCQKKYYYRRRFPQKGADQITGPRIIAKARELVIRVYSREFAANDNNQSGKL